LPNFSNPGTSLDDVEYADLPEIGEMAVNHVAKPDVLTDMLALRASSPFDFLNVALTFLRGRI
jgi:hypothetical protein